MSNKFDITEMSRAFRFSQLDTSERAELMREFQHAVNHNEQLKRLLAEVGMLAHEHGHGPVGVLKLGMAYGLTLGVLMERERLRRNAKEALEVLQ